MARKEALMGVKAVDAQLDYNILLGRSFMYSIKYVTPSLFQVMMFPYNGKVVTIDQLTYHVLDAKGSLNNTISRL